MTDFKKDKKAMQMLVERGLGWEAIKACQLSPAAYSGIQYPCYTPSGQHIIRTKTNPDRPKGVPKYISPERDSLPDDLVLYIPDIKRLKDAVSWEGGKIFITEGEPDVWVFAEAGVYNCASLFGSGTGLREEQLEPIKAQLIDWLQAKKIIYIADADTVGMKTAYTFSTYMSDFADVEVKVLGDIGSKDDATDFWLASNKDPATFMTALESTPPVKATDLVIYKPMTSASKFDDRQMSVAFTGDFTKYVAEVKKRLPTPSDNPSRNSHFSCVNPRHEDKNPSARISYDVDKQVGIYVCHCEATINWATVGDWVGLNYKDWLRDNGETQKPKAPSKMNATTEVAPNPALNATVANVSPEIVNMLIDSDSINLREVVYTRRQAIDRYKRRLRGEEHLEFMPLINPIRALHQFSGMGEILHPGLLWGIKAPTGGGKTMLSDVIVDIFAQQNIDGVVFSGEWAWYKQADRAVRRHDEQGFSLTPNEVSKLEIAHKEMEDLGGIRFGAIPAGDRIDYSIQLADWVNQFPGEVFYIDQFGIDLISLLATVQKTVTVVRNKIKIKGKDGKPDELYNPQYIVLDYLQLLQVPSVMAGQMTIEHMILLIKAVCAKLGLVVILLSQMTKEASRQIQKGKPDVEGGMNLRDFQLNFATTIRIQSTTDQQRGLMTVNVTKNSEGKGTGHVYLPIEWKQMTVHDEALSEDEANALARIEGYSLSAPDWDDPSLEIERRDLHG